MFQPTALNPKPLNPKPQTSNLRPQSSNPNSEQGVQHGEHLDAGRERDVGRPLLAPPFRRPAHGLTTP